MSGRRTKFLRNHQEVIGGGRLSKRQLRRVWRQLLAPAKAKIAGAFNPKPLKKELL